MQIAVAVTTFGLFVLLMVVGLIEVTIGLSNATLPGTLSGFTEVGPVLVAAGTLAAIGGGVISLISERGR